MGKIICFRADLPRARKSFLAARHAILEDVCDVAPHRAEAAALVARAGIPVARGDGLVYRVVPGDALRGSRIAALYTSRALRRIVSAITGVRIYLSPHERSALNVNRLGEPGDRYRMHFDAHPHSALLFLTDARADDGGDLLLRPPGDGQEIAVPPRAGTLIVFDGTRVEHGVAPILRSCERLSVPMVFPDEPNLARPEHLDDYLYGTR